MEESDLKKELKVVFDDEDGIDAGGVRKEYYLLMMKKLLDPSYGMFKYFPESRFLWFSSDCLEQVRTYICMCMSVSVFLFCRTLVHPLTTPPSLLSLLQPSEYEMIGTLLGVAIYNAIIVDLNMPSVLYKKLKGQASTLDDLEELMPSLAQVRACVYEYI